MKLSGLFTVPEGERVTDAQFRKVLYATVIGILLSMTGLVSTTWVLFSSTIV